MPDAPPVLRARLLAALQQGRIVVFGLVVFGLMAMVAPAEFASAGNVANLVRATSTDALAAAGFTLVLLCGELDLSIGVTMTTGAVVLVFAQPVLGWLGAALAAALAGALIGLFNGVLTARVKISSFIVTLGTMTILQGLNRALLQGGSKALADVQGALAASAWLQPVLPWSPRVVLIFVPIVVLELVLRRTPLGRNLYLLGGNKQTAFLAGVRTEAYVIGAFVASGVLCALGGVFTAAAQNTVMPNLGDKSLMLVIAAVIAGGTAMSGGRGSVAMSVVALGVLNLLTNGLSYLGAAKSVKLVANGAVLAAVVAADAWRAAARERLRGRRHELLAERDEPALAATEEAMQTSDRTLATVCVTAIACVAIVAILALAMRRDRAPQAPAAPVVTNSPSAPAPVAAPAVDVAAMKATDGQPLIHLDDSPLQAPPRPADPAKLADDDLLRWYDSEFAGWNVKKLPQPPSPRSGPRGKKVISIQYMDHPYFTGYCNGMRRLAEAYGMELTTMEAGNDNKVQADQVEQVIRMKPDLVIVNPVDSNGCVPMLKRLYEAKIPTIASNLLPVDEGMRYVITWVGPDDWGQFRMLAREFAKQMKNQGDYCVIRHVAGTSCYLSRTWGAVSELKKIAPQMHCLDMQSTDLKTEETKTQVAAWLKKYGTQLKGIVSADDSKAQVGICEALADAGRTDVVCVSAGASRTGLEYVAKGQVHAVTYQSAEGDGALPIEIAARWFEGKTIDRPVYYLAKQIITASNVKEFLPAQW